MSLGTVSVTARVTNSAGTDQERMDIAGVVASALGVSGQRQTLTLTTGFNAVTVPTGASAVVMQVTAGAVTLVLKGVTGDTGVAIQASALTSVPIVLPLGTTPSLGLTAGGAATIDALWI